jgi:tetratricopeptide (TPR) repeat protein
MGTGTDSVVHMRAPGKAGMKVVFFRGVKKYGLSEISAGSSWIIGWFLLLMCVPSALPAYQGTVQIGGGPDRARIVFGLERHALPVLEQKDQTLIVNFPNTVGKPATFTDIFIISRFAFDGKMAVISMNRPFTYTGSTSGDSPQFILDIALKQDASAPCPIDYIESNIHDAGVAVGIVVNPGKWPEVRCIKNKRVYLLFDGETDCTGIEQKLSLIPYITFDGLVRLEDATAFSFSLTGENVEMEVNAQELYNKVVLNITAGSGSRPKIYGIARSAYEQGDIAAAIHTLEPYRSSLDAQESILLARAYWKISFPYHMDSRSIEALKLMSEGVQAMVPGLPRETVMLEYSRMLLHASMHSDAVTYIQFLKESQSPEIAAEAYVAEIDVLNKKGEFQDAFVQNKRMINDLGENAVPERLKPYYLSVLADTYLGLSAYPRALKLYREALALDPEFFRTDPDLYARMAEAAYRLNDFAGAKDYMLSAVNLSRKDNKAEYLVTLGDCLYKMGRKGQAMSVFSEVENIAPQSESGIIAKLKTARIIMDKDLADDGQLSDKGFYEIIDIYENLKSSPEYQEGPLGSIIKIRIAQTYAHRRDWENALASYLRAWTDTKKDDPVHVYVQTEAEKCILARLQELFRQEAYDMVLDLYTEYRDSFMHDIQDLETRFILATSFHRLGHADQARGMFISCIEKPSSRSEEALYSLYAIDHARGDYAGALKWNTRYLESYPRGKNASVMRENRGPLLYYTSNLEEAISYLEQITDKGDEKALTALSMLADAHEKLGDPDRTIATLEKIIGFPEAVRSPVIEKALYVRAIRLKETSETARSQDLFARLLDQYPQSAYRDWALYHLAEISRARGDTGEAARLLDTVIQRSTDKVLHELAMSLQGELGLAKDLREFSNLKDRFREK